MQQLLRDVDSLIEGWDVWSVVSTNECLREVQIQRSDEDHMIVTISATSTYPRGSLTLTSNFGGMHETCNQSIEEALDAAMEVWCMEEEPSMGAPNHSSAVFEMAVNSSAVELVVPQELHAAEELLARDVADPRLNGHAASFFSNSRKEFVVRVAVPLRAVEQFRANSLGLKRDLALVVELHWHWRYLNGSDMPKIHNVFMCDVKHLAREVPPSHDPNTGALKWYLTHRLGDALRKNHIRSERRALGFEEHDKRNHVEGLSDWAFKYAQEDFYNSGNTNILKGIQDFISLRLEKCTSSCLICDKSLDFDGMRTGICSGELCRHSLENYGIGTDVLSEIRNSAVVSELLIYLSCASVSQGARRDTLTPMCPIDIDRSIVPNYGGPTHFYRGRYGDENSKDWATLERTVQKIPSISKMTTMAKGNTSTLRQRLNEIDPLAYPLLQWILASNRTHLEPIPAMHSIEGMGKHQFYLISSHPEKERIFRQRRASIAASTGKSGSFFAWHGSASGNWHCILRNGLKNYSGTKFMSAGQAYGPGIYLARCLDISLGYMGSPSGAWRGAEHIPHKSGCTLLALCEVVADGKGYKDHGNDIVTVQDEDLIDTRFLFVFADSERPANHSVRAENLKIPEELLQHCR